MMTDQRNTPPCGGDSMDSCPDIDPRAQSVVLVAQALKLLRDHEHHTSAAHRLHRLRWCMDGLLLLSNRMPTTARVLFDRLDTKVQVLSIQLAKDPHALDAVREELIKSMMHLGDLLMSDLLPSGEGG